MLVLTRRNNEAVVIGGAKRLNRLLKVTVVDISKGKVRLGFEAADDVAVHRLEVWEEIRVSGLPGNRGKGSPAPVAP